VPASRKAASDGFIFVTQEYNYGPSAVLRDAIDWVYTDDHVFLSAGNRRISSSMVEYTFRRIRRLAGITPSRTRPPRIHDLRQRADCLIMPTSRTALVWEAPAAN
jgi:NAD(P)H-dependent FMN reductase